MSGRQCLLSLVTVLAWSGIASAEASVLDLIPQDATAAVAVRNLNQLKKKGDNFIAAAEIDNLGRPSQLVERLLDAHGLKGVDTDGSFALVAVNPQTIGIKLWTEKGNLNPAVDWTDLLVAVVPFRDADAIAASFDIPKGKLKPDMMTTGKGKQFGRFFYVRGKHVFFGNHEQAVRNAATARRSGAELPAARRRVLDRADILGQLNRKAFDPIWTIILAEMRREMEKDADEGEKTIIGQFFAALAIVRTSWLAVRIDQGLGLSWVNTFPKEGKDGDAARTFLMSLRGGSGGADLAGLPEGRVIAAEAFRGDGSQNAALLKLFTRLAWSSLRGSEGFISPVDRPGYVNVFAELWKHFKGTRVAVYQNADRLKHGLFSVAAILDTDDAAKFLGELRLLVRLGGTDLDLTGKVEGKADVAIVEKLIGELGDDAFRVRESASTKLALVGEPALPFLDKALKSEDPEVRRRARALKEGIVAKAAARRKELLSPDALKHVRPTFAFAPKAEMLDDTRLDVVRIRLTEAAAAAKLRELLGPDWDRIRLAVHGRQVVVLLGSDQELLRATLKNLKAGKRGLADTKTLSASNAHLDPTRQVEFHLSVAAAYALWTAADLRRPAGKSFLSSFALAVEPDLLHLDVWLPATEFKILNRAGQSTPQGANP
jgi:hypothetical protein